MATPNPRLEVQCRQAEAIAKKLVESLEIRSADEIDITLIAASCGAFVRFRPLAKEEGRLLRSGATGLIVVSARACQTQKWRFVVAHELGHFLGPEDPDQFHLCTDLDLHRWYEVSGHEAAANAFAAELLMPEALFKPKCDLNQPSLHDVAGLADEFETSLTATALRFIRYTPEPCAVVHSTGGQIDWWYRAPDFRLFLRRGHKLGRDTYAGDLFAGEEVGDRSQLVSGEGWTGDPGDEMDIHEHSRLLGQYGSVLTLLWHPFR